MQQHKTLTAVYKKNCQILACSVANNSLTVSKTVGIKVSYLLPHNGKLPNLAISRLNFIFCTHRMRGDSENLAGCACP